METMREERCEVIALDGKLALHMSRNSVNGVQTD